MGRLYSTRRWSGPRRRRRRPSKSKSNSSLLPASESCWGLYSRRRSPRLIEHEQQLPSESTQLPTSCQGRYSSRSSLRPICYEHRRVAASVRVHTTSCLLQGPGAVLKKACKQAQQCVSCFRPVFHQSFSRISSRRSTCRLPYEMAQPSGRSRRKRSCGFPSSNLSVFDSVSSRSSIIRFHMSYRSKSIGIGAKAADCRFDIEP